MYFPEIVLRQPNTALMRSEQSVGHAEEKRIETSKAIRPMRAEERDFG